LTWKSQFLAKLSANSCPHGSTFCTRISRVVEDVEVPGGERGNVQTSVLDRVSLKRQPDCSTSVTIATGPTDEEEEGDISWGLTIVGHTVVGIGVTEFQCLHVDEDCAIQDDLLC